MEKDKSGAGTRPGNGLAMKNTYPPRNQFNTFMIVQTRRINAGINRLAHSFCSNPPPRINGIFHRGRRREWVRGGLKVPYGEGENENRLGGN